MNRTVNRCRLLIFIVLLTLLLTVPTLAQDAVSTAVPTPTLVIEPQPVPGVPDVLFWVSGILALLVVALSALMILLLRDKARAGDEHARHLLDIARSLRDMLPLDELDKFLTSAERRADLTTTPIDNLLVELGRRGYDFGMDVLRDDTEHDLNPDNGGSPAGGPVRHNR
jgi:hypothetical protein